jgi:hypothetical protein
MMRRAKSPDALNIIANINTAGASAGSRKKSIILFDAAFGRLNRELQMNF